MPVSGSMKEVGSCSSSRPTLLSSSPISSAGSIEGVSSGSPISSAGSREMIFSGSLISSGGSIERGGSSSGSSIAIGSSIVSSSMESLQYLAKY